MKRKLLAALLALLPGVAAAQTPPPARPATRQPSPAQTGEEPRPAIWLLSDADTRIYVFGSLHALSPGLRWRSPAIDRIIREADELVIEVSDRELIERGPNPFDVMLMGKSVPILQRISPERREALARLLRDLKVPEGGFDSLETWAIATLLGLAYMGRHLVGGGGQLPDVEAASGVEAVLITEFRARGRPISGAETGAAVFGAFRRLPLNEQQAMLDEVVDVYRTPVPAGGTYETGWVRGNLDSFAVAVDALPPRLLEMIMTRRNRNFADYLANRLARPGTVLFAVGAGHLTGRVSVQSMLESRGLRVQRIY
jgi:uncharacterized protein YbaP (TraB family)